MRSAHFGLGVPLGCLWAAFAVSWECFGGAFGALGLPLSTFGASCALGQNALCTCWPWEFPWGAFGPPLGCLGDAFWCLGGGCGIPLGRLWGVPSWFCKPLLASQACRLGGLASWLAGWLAGWLLGRLDAWGAGRQRNFGGHPPRFRHNFRRRPSEISLEISSANLRISSKAPRNFVGKFVGCVPKFRQGHLEISCGSRCQDAGLV